MGRGGEGSGGSHGGGGGHFNYGSSRGGGRSSSNYNPVYRTSYYRPMTPLGGTLSIVLAIIVIVAGLIAARPNIQQSTIERSKLDSSLCTRVDTWYQDDASATIALDKATEYETLVNTWKVKVANATKDADAMRNKLNGMARDINEMKAKASEIKADLANAEASKAVSKVQKVSGESAFSRFDKLAEKAERERAEAEAMASLDQPIPDAGDDVLNKYANGGGGATSAKLAELKARLGK